jgi:hypothetical protein
MLGGIRTDILYGIRCIHCRRSASRLAGRSRDGESSSPPQSSQTHRKAGAFGRTQLVHLRNPKQWDRVKLVARSTPGYARIAKQRHPAAKHLHECSDKMGDRGLIRMLRLGGTRISSVGWQAWLVGLHSDCSQVCRCVTSHICVNG